MEENIEFEEGKNRYNTFSELLSLLVDDLNNYSKKFQRSEIDRCLSLMDQLSQSMSKKTQQIFKNLKKEVEFFLQEPNNLEKVISQCVKLKNELWEL